MARLFCSMVPVGAKRQAALRVCSACCKGVTCQQSSGARWLSHRLLACPPLCAPPTPCALFPLRRLAQLLQLTCIQRVITQHANFKVGTFHVLATMDEKDARSCCTRCDSQRPPALATPQNTNHTHSGFFVTTICRKADKTLHQIPSASSNLMWFHTGASVFAVIIPLAAAAGTPIPGMQLSPQR